MLITISTTHQPATDLGFLLGKHPERVQTFKITGGKAHVFYPEASIDKCTCALFIALDTVEIVRKMKTPLEFSLQNYVNDRPFVGSSFTTSAIAEVFGSALNGNCKDLPELAKTPIPLEISMSVVKAFGGKSGIERLFQPLGYEVEAEGFLLDQKFDFGESPYFHVQLKANKTLQEALSHLYILLPVFDKEKHYWVSENDLNALLKKGEGWLENHPEKDWIIGRYLKLPKLIRPAMEKLGLSEEETEKELQVPDVRLHDVRLDTVVQKLLDLGVQTALDAGCGEGKLLKRLIAHPQFKKIGGMDISMKALQIAKRRLHLERIYGAERERISLFQGALTYKDDRFKDFEAIALVEVIEHLDEDRLSALEKSLFGFARPKFVVLTTPRADYNAKFADNGQVMRHADHRFEWTSAQFKAWADRVATEYDYKVSITDIGYEDETFGAPSQMAVFLVISD